MALPHKPIIIIDAPSLVYFPSPSSANGQMPAQTNELAKPSNTTNQIDISATCPNSLTWLWQKIISIVNKAPSIVHILNALTWLINLGMAIIPNVKPQTVAKRVYDGNTLASSNGIRIDVA